MAKQKKPDPNAVTTANVKRWKAAVKQERENLFRLKHDDLDFRPRLEPVKGDEE